MTSAMLAALASAGTLDKLVIITRHGERERLAKNYSSLSEAGGPEGGPALIAEGLAHISHVGAALRARYLDPASCGTRCLVGALGSGRFAPHELHAESSGLARTLGTAEALLSTLVPSEIRGGLPIPVYSQPDANDYILRGYTKCPALSAKQHSWRTTAAFARKEVESTALRADVARALGASASQTVQLADWWNAYDALATYPEQLVSADTLAAAEALAAWLESRAFGVSGGGELSGGALLGEVARRLSATAPGGALLDYFSAHYPVMLSLLTALGVAADSSDEHAWLGERLLAHGSALAFELHTAGEGAPLRLTLAHFAPPTDGAAAGWRERRQRRRSAEEDAEEGAAGGGDGVGDDAASAYSDPALWRELPLPCAADGCAGGGGALAALSAALATPAAWCAACANTQLPACAASAAAEAACTAGGLGVRAEAALLVGIPLLLIATLVGTWVAFRARRPPVAPPSTATRSEPAGKRPAPRTASRGRPVVHELTSVVLADGADSSKAAMAA